MLEGANAFNNSLNAFENFDIQNDYSDSDNEI
jgi:hypothetical protein